MPKYLIALTNPSSPDKEDAFNAWYNTYHVPEVCALDGFVGAKRFKADATQFADPDFSYAVIYEVEDAATALASLAPRNAGPHLAELEQSQAAMAAAAKRMAELIERRFADSVGCDLARKQAALCRRDLQLRQISPDRPCIDGSPVQGRQGRNQALSRNSRRSTLPVTVFGNSSMISTMRGYLYAARRSLQNSRISSGSAWMPGRRLTTALTVSPR